MYLRVMLKISTYVYSDIKMWFLLWVWTKRLTTDLASINPIILNSKNKKHTQILYFLVSQYILSIKAGAKDS